MDKTKMLKSFYKMRITAMALFICLFSSCSNEEATETLEEEAIIESPELSFSKSISLEDEYGNSISFDVSTNDQAELDSYSASSFEFKAMTQEDILAGQQEDILSEENEESLDDDQTEEEDQELSTADSIVFKETNVQLNEEDGFVAYQLAMKPEASDGLEDKSRRRRTYEFSTSRRNAIVNSRRLRKSKKVHANFYAKNENNNLERGIWSGRICCLTFKARGLDGGLLAASRFDRLHVKVRAKSRKHFAVSFFGR